MKRILLILLLLGLIFTPANAGNVVTMFKTQGGGGEPPSVVTAWRNISTGGTGGTITISPSSGNLLVGFVLTLAASDISTMSDATNGNFTKIATSGNNVRITLFYLPNVSSGSRNVTFSGGAGSDYSACFIYEISGASTSSPFATGEYAITGGTSVSPVTNALTNASSSNSLYIAGFVDGIEESATITLNNATFTSPAVTWSAHANGYNTDGSVTMHGGTAYYSASSSVSRVHGWTIGAEAPWNSIVACFNP